MITTLARRLVGLIILPSLPLVVLLDVICWRFSRWGDTTLRSSARDYWRLWLDVYWRSKQ